MFSRWVNKVINTICKGVLPMAEEKDKPEKPKRAKSPSEWAKEENQEPKKQKPKIEDNHVGDDGCMYIRLTVDDSALVVRSDGTVEVISHELENSDEGYVGDIEDLSKTFSLVLALASALENEDLYNRIYHNLNMVLMKKWDSIPEDIKNDIIEKRKDTEERRTEEEEIEKNNRVIDFRKRMSKYKDKFIDDMESEKNKLKRDMRDEEEFHRRFGKNFGPDMEGMSEFDPMPKPEKKNKKKKQPSLNYLKGIDWNTKDKSLKAHFKDYRPDEPPDFEE